MPLSFESQKCNSMETEKVLVPVKRVAVKRVAVKKIYAPHECFGSPLSICRICGEKYTYTAKPYSVAGLSNSSN